jgi:flagellar basal-body rod protein FlgF
VDALVDIGTLALLGRGLALRRQVDVIANNIANASTTGFRREATVFGSYIGDMREAPEAGDRATYQTLDYGTVQDISDGPFQSTGNPLDIAIQGPGYFAVSLPEGISYTRDGALRVGADGFVELANGRVLDDGGKPIQIPEGEAGQLRVTSDGSLVGSGLPIARLAIMVGDEARADPRGSGLVNLPDARLLPASQTRLRVGGLEGSNVQAVVESTRLIEATRSYQNTQRMAEDINDLRRSAIGRLGRVGN